MSNKELEQFKALMTKAFKMTADPDPSVKYKGARMLAKAFELPLRKGVFAGDIVTSLFQSIPYDYATLIEYPLDPISPGTEKEYVAYTIPGEGDLPTKHSEADYVAVPTYEVGHAVSWLSRHARDARWDILARYMEVMEAGFVKKRNDDGWRTLIAAAVDRNIIVADSQASVGVLTKRVISNAKLVFTRNGGGNSASIDRRFLTDMYLSPEMVEEMRNWGIDQIDEITRREIYLAGDGGERLSRVFGVNLIPIHELGETQEYQRYFSTDLGASLASGDVELMIGVNSAASNTFMHPVRQEPFMVPDQRLTDFRKAGLMGMADWGWGILDNRDVLAISC